MEILFRRSAPNRFDQVPLGTLYHCPTVEGSADDSKSFDIWVQTNKDDSYPVWKRAGTFNSLFDSRIEREVATLLQGRVVVEQ